MGILAIEMHFSVHTNPKTQESMVSQQLLINGVALDGCLLFGPMPLAETHAFMDKQRATLADVVKEAADSVDPGGTTDLYVSPVIKRETETRQ